MKISVIVPVYNGEKYILQCLDSVKNQTYTNLEVIVVNDGSKDGSLEILNQYVLDHPEMDIKIISKENAGLPQARKTGVEKASGEYIGFLDVDDWIEPSMYWDMMEKAKEEDADVVCCGISMDFPEGKSQFLYQPEEILTPICGPEALKYMHDRTGIYPYAWNKIYKRDILKKIKYPKGNFVGEDYAITTQAFVKAKKVCGIKGISHHYIQIVNSMCHGGYSENYIHALASYSKIQNVLRKKYPEYADSICNYMMVEYMAMIVAMGKNNTYNHKMIQFIQRYVKRHLVTFLKTKNVPIVMKGSAIAVSIHYKILVLVYNIMAKF